MTTSTLETLTETYIVPAGHMDRLQGEIDRLNKRARRLKVAEIQVDIAPSHLTHEIRTVGGEIRYVTQEQLDAHSNWTPTGYVREFLSVTVTGEAPKFAGWNLVAVLEPLSTDDGVENIIQAVPGQKCPVEYRDRVGQCDHCHTERRRNQTFVCRHVDGRHQMVGRNCLADFLGHTDPHHLAKMAEMLGELASLCEAAADEEWNEGGASMGGAYSLDCFMAMTAASIVVDGWLSRGKAFEFGGIATANKTLEALNPLPKQDRDYREWVANMQATAAAERQQATAAAAIAWAAELTEEEIGDSDYLYNLCLVCRAGYVTGKTAGLAASLIVAHARAVEAEVRQREFAKRAETSKHQGVVGERIWRKLTLERVHYSESFYGTTAIHGMCDDDGNAYTWFASNELSDFDKGDSRWILATVKSHGEYKGIAQTVLTRCSLCDADEYVVALAKLPKAGLQKQIEELTGESCATGTKKDLAARIAELQGG
jgi:hypothetical protein